MILAEYLRFLQTLNSTAVPTDIRKLANLVGSAPSSGVAQEVLGPFLEGE